MLHQRILVCRAFEKVTDMRVVSKSEDPTLAELHGQKLLWPEYTFKLIPLCFGSRPNRSTALSILGLQILA